MLLTWNKQVSKHEGDYDTFLNHFSDLKSFSENELLEGKIEMWKVVENTYSPNAGM